LAFFGVFGVKIVIISSKYTLVFILFWKNYAVKKISKKTLFTALCSKTTFLPNSVGTFTFWTNINVHFKNIL